MQSVGNDAYRGRRNGRASPCSSFSFVDHGHMRPPVQLADQVPGLEGRDPFARPHLVAKSEPRSPRKRLAPCPASYPFTPAPLKDR